MRIGRITAAVLAGAAAVTVPAGPAVAGTYCRTTADRVSVYAEPRADSPVVHEIPTTGMSFRCGGPENLFWWRASDDDDPAMDDGTWQGFVETRLSSSDCC